MHAVEDDNQVLKEAQKFLLPFVHHPFEVKSSSAKKDIDVVSYDSFVEVADHPMITFYMADHRLYGRPATKGSL